MMTPFRKLLLAGVCALLPGAPPLTAQTDAATTPPATVFCVAEGSARRHCDADTSGGIALIRATGTAPCLLGRNWGYDDHGVWIAEGCGGEFVLGQSTRPAPTPPPPPPTSTAAPVASAPQPIEGRPSSAPEAEPKPSLTIYGAAMLDMGYQSGQSHPDWFDVLRTTKLPSYENQYGNDGNFFSGVRQSRLGVKAKMPTALGEVKTTFEFELFGTGADAGQTTFRLRHAYGELGHFGAGQTWSPFMDVDVFPNSLEYWGPAGMVFFRNVQLRWMPIQGDTFLTFALERPGASGDGGTYADRIELQNIKGRFPYPDLSAEYRMGTDWGYLEVAGILRYIKWEDLLEDQYDLSGSDMGWGINLSSNIQLGKNVLRLQTVYGEGVENYMNDAPADLGPRLNPGSATRPLVGELLPVLGLVAFLDLNWSDKMTSTIGYSSVDIDNSSGQAADAYSKGEYALANVLFYPARNVMFGPEIQWGKRHNFKDGFTSDDLRFQFSVKYNFSHTMEGK